MEKVKRLVEAGADVGGAIRLALPMSISAFAEKHGLPRSTTSEAIHSQRRATDAQLTALAAELGGTVAEWRELLPVGQETAVTG